MAEIKWEITRGISEAMVSGFLNSIFFSESELGLEGVIQTLVDGVQDETEYALVEFASTVKADDYASYILENTGKTVQSYDANAVRTYISDRGLQDEFRDYVLRNKWKWNGEYQKDMVREMVVRDRLEPLFENARSDDIYIYRDGDHWGVHLSRIQ